MCSSICLYLEFLHKLLLLLDQILVFFLVGSDLTETRMNLDQL